MATLLASTPNGCFLRSSACSTSGLATLGSSRGTLLEPAAAGNGPDTFEDVSMMFAVDMMGGNSYPAASRLSSHC